VEPQSVAVQIEQLKGRISTMEKTMDQHFQSLEKLTSFANNFGTWIAKHEEREEVMEEQQTSRHESNSTKLNIIATCIALSTVLVMAIGIIVTIYLARHAQLEPPKIFHSHMLDPEYAGSKYSATIPPLTR
jgi:ABC-type phosphate transport system permease subunit